MDTEPDKRPDPRDFDTREKYEEAMDAYLSDLTDGTGFTSPFDVLRSWRENPPADGHWE